MGTVALGVVMALAWIPAKQVRGDESFRRAVMELAAKKTKKLEAPDGGPVPTGPATRLARELVKGASRDQLTELLRVDSAAVRAYIAREIARHRKEEVALLRALYSDKTRIEIESANDVPPMKAVRTTVGEFVKQLAEEAK